MTKLGNDKKSEISNRNIYSSPYPPHFLALKGGLWYFGCHPSHWVSGGLAGIDMVWRKGGVARKLGRDEQHLHDALRWLGLSSRSMTEAEASAWEQAEAIKVDTVLETRPR